MKKLRINFTVDDLEKMLDNYDTEGDRKVFFSWFPEDQNGNKIEVEISAGDEEQ